MARQNRVTPFGGLIATPDRGTFMGNRGLPEGVFVTVPAWGEEAYLVRGSYLFAWSPAGYCERRGRPKGTEVEVLTPPSTVAAIRAGYAPQVHPSAVALA